MDRLRIGYFRDNDTCSTSQQSCKSRIEEARLEVEIKALPASSPTNILEQLKERYVLNGVLRLKW